jgi:hypothetical protein
VIRILQENAAPSMAPCRNSVFTDNLVAFRSQEVRPASALNVGRGTAAETFTFARNWWLCIDTSPRSRPTLPAPEKDGTYGSAPVFVGAEHGDLHQQEGSPAVKCGAYVPRP